MTRFITLLAVCLFSTIAVAQPAPIVFTRPAYSLSFSPADGSLLSFRQANQQESIVQPGKAGLWQLRFADGSTLSASTFSSTNPARNLRIVSDEKSILLTYTSDEANVTITGTAADGHFDLRGQVTPGTKTVLEFALPAQLRFDPATLDRLIAPDAGLAVGTAFQRTFFQAQPPERPAGWEPTITGPAHYRSLYGGEPEMRPVDDPPVALQAGKDAAAWLTPSVIASLPTQKAIVNRPPSAGQADVVVADSANGAFLSASRLGGTGLLWRFGGMVRQEQAPIAVEMGSAVFRKLADSAPRGRQKIGVLSLVHGPAAGAWTDVAVRRWVDTAGSAANAAGLPFIALSTPAQLRTALQGNDYLLIVNPYGEWLPVSAAGESSQTVAAIGQFVRNGGNWLEAGGYPFFAELRPMKFLSRRLPYPHAFADFVQIDSSRGSLAIYGVQPLKDPRDTSTLFVPAQLEWGAEADGGYFRHAFHTYVPAKGTWASPAVRLAPGQNATANIKDYTLANALTRTLASKAPAAVVEKLKASVLVKYDGSAAEKIAHLKQLPVPSLVHFSDYLKGGFDKEYPDHLPPNAKFGTSDELRTFLTKGREMGHLMMPYTNSTWWCDHPRGPTFLREGDAPLAKDLAGKPYYEKYSMNDGWTTTMWHPAVQAANRATLTAFTRDYPVDVLLEDQLGARSWVYDTNPASPTPYAYSHGMLAHTATDAAAVPVSTENGWDRIAEHVVQMCGLSWEVVPNEDAPTWRQLHHDRFPAGTWEIFPLAQYIAHDKALFVGHDLGQFVTNQQTLAWTLGLGFGLSYRTPAAGLDGDTTWLQWLAQLQKSVAARYAGQALTAFDHERGEGMRDGLLRSQYSDLRIVANLEDKPQRDGARQLAAYGFAATGPDLTATDVYILDGKPAKADLWVYAAPGQRITFDVPWTTKPSRLAVTFDAQPAQELTELAVTTPTEAATANTSLTAPRTWPGPKPAIGVIELGPGVTPVFSPVSSQQWVTSLSAAPEIRATGMQVKVIGSAGELAAALKAGPKAYLTIVNPYGELFPVDRPDSWRAMLDLIRTYTRQGGHWWEVGGYSFYGAMSQADGTWTRTPVESAGAAHLGLRIAFGETDAAAEALTVTAAGQHWLGDKLAAQITRQRGIANRGVATGPDAPETLSLVTTARATQATTYIGGQRLGGSGYLWRVGGFNPDAAISLPTVAAVIGHVYMNPPPPPASATARRLYHATVSAK